MAHEVHRDEMANHRFHQRLTHWGHRNLTEAFDLVDDSVREVCWAWLVREEASIQEQDQRKGDKVNVEASSSLDQEERCYQVPYDEELWWQWEH